MAGEVLGGWGLGVFCLSPAPSLPVLPAASVLPLEAAPGSSVPMSPGHWGSVTPRPTPPSSSDLLVLPGLAHGGHTGLFCWAGGEPALALGGAHCVEPEAEGGGSARRHAWPRPARGESPPATPLLPPSLAAGGGGFPGGSALHGQWPRPGQSARELERDHRGRGGDGALTAPGEPRQGEGPGRRETPRGA